MTDQPLGPLPARLLCLLTVLASLLRERGRYFDLHAVASLGHLVDCESLTGDL